MADILEHVRDKLDWLADEILDRLTGSRKYRLQEVKAQVPDARKIAGSRKAHHLPPAGPSCGR